MSQDADVKRRAKPTELKAGDDVLVKHTRTKDKSTSYWKNYLLTVTKMNRPTIIVRRKRDEKVFSRNISMVKKYKHISDSDDHSDIHSSRNSDVDSAGMNTENPHPGNSNTDSVQNVDSANKARRSSRTRNPRIRFGETCTH